MNRSTWLDRTFRCETCKYEFDYSDIRTCGKCNKHWCAEGCGDWCAEWAGISHTWLEGWYCNDCIPLILEDIQEDCEKAKLKREKNLKKAKRQKIY